ncbi:hypothetical protein FRC10_000256 [Ceratobasidium sp. 414]|nr:hypothetical protein FRC10_000256 [Ceratobasidium sp. 414]
MSSSQHPAHTIASPASSLDSRLLELLCHLLELPHALSDHPKIYPFAQFSLDPHDVEHYGSTQNALNHRLELIFGSRSVGQPIEFHGRGASLEAIVYVLHKYIDGEGGDNVPLWRWVTELKDAAIQTAKSVSEPAVKTASRNVRSRPGGKRNAPKPRTKLSDAQITAAKQKTAIRYPHNPADLEDNPPDVEPGTGRVRDDLLDKLTIPCHSITDPLHKRSRCRGAGCGWSWADPRVVVRVIRHAIKCDGVDVDLCAEAKRRAAALSLASKLHGPSMETEIADCPMGSIGSTQKQEDVVNHALLKWICDRMVAPSAVDCPSWRELVSALNPNIKTASGSTIAENFVSTEAAYIRQSSINKLLQHGFLTLSFDGGTTRKRESVYTVHVTTPKTREAYLMEGNEASGVSHTADHVCSVIDKVLRDIGPEQFSSIVSDNAGNHCS